MRDILNEVFEITVDGNNRYDNRWFIKKQINEEYAPIFDMHSLDNFIQVFILSKFKKFNKLAKWSSFKTFMLRVLALLYFPLYETVNDRLRR
jgi:hypothetical protein